MDKNRQKDFARRISQANRTEMVVITYDIITEEIDCALKAIADGNKDECRADLKSAQRFLGEIMSALDYKYEISVRLLSLYEYVQRILVSSDISGEDRGLSDAKNVITGLRKSFAEIAKNDESGAVMQNSQNVYAGLTYGRGSLNETDISDGSNRGFLA